MSAVTTPPNPQRTIVLKCDSLGEKYLEGRVEAAKSITPGMLVERTATSGTDPDGFWQPHSTQGGPAEAVVAMELGFVADVPYASTFSGGTIDDAYAANDVVRMHECQPGDELYMFLKANGSAVTPVDFLQSAGNGDLEKQTSTNQRLFKALESVTPGTSRTRIRVRKL